MTCRMAGCERPAVTTVNVSGVGPRELCQEHIAWMTAQGMAIGPLARRRLTASQPRPETLGSGPAWLRWTREHANAKETGGVA